MGLGFKTKCLDYTLEGKTEQERITGKNILKIIDFEPITYYGMSVSCKDNVIKIKGTTNGSGPT